MTVITRTSYLTVNSVPLDTPAWWITNLEPEIRRLALKGNDTDVAHAHGGLGNPRRRAINPLLFSLIVVGHVNKDNTTQSPWQTGLETNLDYLEANLGIASTSGDGSVPAVWHRWDGTTKAADVIVSHWEPAELGNSKKHIVVALELTVPAGRFT